MNRTGLVYGFINKTNGKWYVGQTVQKPERRKAQHINSSFNENDVTFNNIFHMKIREYGPENFDFVILEDNIPIDKLDEREIFWIANKQSFVRTGKGYNSTTGGQLKTFRDKGYWDNRSSLESYEHLLHLIDEIKNDSISLVELAKKYNISLSIICAINSGAKYHQSTEEYPLRPLRAKVDQTTVSQIIILLKENCTNLEIANALGVDTDVVYRINYGRSHKQPDIDYPIRKGLSKKEQRAIKIKCLLEENKLNNKEIALKVGCDPSVVSNINYGKNFRDKNRPYPIRPTKMKPVSTILESEE